jgi:hypothetical protein
VTWKQWASDAEWLVDVTRFLLYEQVRQTWQLYRTVGSGSKAWGASGPSQTTEFRTSGTLLSLRVDYRNGYTGSRPHLVPFHPREGVVDCPSALPAVHAEQS